MISAYSRPYPKVPDAAITGLRKRTPAMVTDRSGAARAAPRPSPSREHLPGRKDRAVEADGLERGYVSFQGTPPWREKSGRRHNNAGCP
jgi:hypothetical protein